MSIGVTELPQEKCPVTSITRKPKGNPKVLEQGGLVFVLTFCGDHLWKLQENVVHIPGLASDSDAGPSEEELVQRQLFEAHWGWTPSTNPSEDVDVVLLMRSLAVLSH